MTFCKSEKSGEIYLHVDHYSSIIFLLILHIIFVFNFATWSNFLLDRNSFPLMYCLYIRKCQTCRNVKDCRATWERLGVGKKYQLMSPGLPLTELQPPQAL